MRIFDFLCSHTLSGIDGYAIIRGEQKITWQDLARQVRALQAALGKDYKKGDRILLVTDDPLWQIIGLLGASAAGLASILTDSSMPTSQKESIFRSESIQGVVDPRNIPENPLSDYPESSTPWASGVAESDLFLGALSSGSTGTPKIIWRDHQSWTRAFPVQQEIFQMGQKDTLFLAGSLLYTANMNSALQILHAGGTLVLAEGPWPRSWIREIKEKQVTGIFMVPANYRLLLQQGERIGNTQVRSLVSAGEKMDRATMKKLQSIFPKAQITEYYGASELGHVSYAQNEEIAEVQGSVGRPFPGVRISIEEGKIWVESPYLAPAYRPRATIHDLGRMDQAGYLYLDGREGSLINAGGIKIVPGQLEDLLLQYEGIKEAVVVGVPDKLRGQKAVAFIVPQWDSLSRKKIQNHLRERLPKHLWPHQFVFLDRLPRNIAGKADRKALAGLDIQDFSK